MGRGQDRAYGVLRQRLVGGHYRPGFHLREEPLAQEFGLSRTPIRAALKRLVEDGLATDAGHGIHVAEWSEADIEETFRLRMLLEPHATELAVQRGGGALVEHLESCNCIMADAIAKNDDDAIGIIQEVNRKFHHTLIIFAGSPRLRSILETMIDMPVVVRSFFLYSYEELNQSLHHHRDIAFAARIRDGELGRRAMQLHLRMSYARVLQHRGSRDRLPVLDSL
ncbi:GntR family transcriptional regulator [Methylobacterium nodulans]|uniref:Transcriptional regulator, GntR family n=1 Tax=Methylobacterium nodulans (strain LMG 21967 / CNCM I-2342 / ORS 2060) TaxID=460265 RepID=B8IWB4_METNO|nr:GntR family transcriptional regulator [Methylobacterium nodulans]ACL62704.1 transcriptional regulator, GntR family [Methylobacterium nodulans ORS 2060]